MKESYDNLHKFVANNYNLEKLQAKLSDFNPLSVLKMDHYEIRHSNIIAWLLDPNENHKLGDAFIKKFLSEVIICNEHIDTNLTVFKLHKENFHNLEVRREWKDIDIFILSESSNRVYIIENKIHASESKQQLNNYYNIVRSEFPEYEVVPIFLTLDGTSPTDKRYGLISYNQILCILKFLVSINKENLNYKVYDFITYYIKTLEILTMEDLEIKRLCKAIYKDNKKALDLIYKYIGETEFENASRDFIENIEAKELDVRSQSANFIPETFVGKLPVVVESNFNQGLPFSFSFSKHSEKLSHIIQIGPFSDEELRRDFLNHLKKYKFKISDLSFKPGAKYTRIYSEYKKFEDWDNKESIVGEMDDLFSNSSNEVYESLLEACISFDWRM